MAASYSETRQQNTILATTAADITPMIVNNAIDSHPAVSVFFGKLSNQMFGPVDMTGKTKRFKTGESIEVRVKLTQNNTFQWMSSGYSPFAQDTQDTATTSRANWKMGGATAIISGMERRNNSGMAKIVDLLEYKVTEAVEATVDGVAQGVFTNGGIATQVTGLEQIIAAGSSSLQNLTAGTNDNWYSRGLSAKGTAPGALTFGGGSFATTGISNWIIAYMNASEGGIQPEFQLTTEDIYRFYEGSLAPEVRYSSLRVGDGSFQALTFKTKPVFHDSYCPSGTTYFINTDYLYAAVSPGADFQATPQAEQQFQDVFSSKILFQGNFVCSARKFQNKVTGQTA